MRLCLQAAVLFLCCQFLLFPATTAKKPVTIDDVLAQHPAGGILPVWAPDGTEFLYSEGGKVWRYDVAAKKAVSWFETSPLEKLAKQPEAGKSFGWQNRRVSSESFQWLPHGESVLASVNGDLFLVHRDGHHEQLTATSSAEEDAKLSPDGKKIVYRTNSNLFVLDVASKKIRQLTTGGSATLLNGQLDWVYPEELDLGTAVWWSPDSKKIAYLQFDIGHEFVYPHADLLGERAVEEPQRYPQSGTANALVKLGVVAVDGGATTWMQVGETSDTLIARVAWTPDSHQLATERLTRIQNQLDLLLCDPASGSGKVLLHEESKTWINLRLENLYFLKTRSEFLWISESSGFDHIYRYSSKTGEQLAQLTTGEWQVNGIQAIDEAKQIVYFTSTEVSPLESQLYGVSLNGGERTRITKEEGLHGIHANLNGSAFVDAYSSSKEPPQTVLRNDAGEEVAVLRPANRKPLEEFDLLPSEFVQLKAADGSVLYGRLIKPAGYQPGTRYPLIVDVYGGPGAQTVRDAWSGVNMDQVFAHRGYLVWQMDGHGSAGRGHAFETPIYHELGKQEVADQRIGVEYLVKMGLTDPQRVGITGWSYGGYMTIRSLLTAPDVFKVGVAGAPVTDWHNYDTIYTERYMGLPGENKRGYTASSNVLDASKLKGHLLLIHNFEDDNVLFQNTMQMVNALELAGKQYDMQLYPQKTHGVSGKVRKTMYEAMVDFFDKNLKVQP